MASIVNEKEIVNFYNSCLDECRTTTSGIRKIWEKNHALYSCQRDFGKKKDWQFRVNTPVCKPKVKKAVNLIKTTQLRAGDYFDFDTPIRSENDPKYREDQLRCNYTKRLVRSHLDSRPCSFLDSLSETLEAAFGWSGMFQMKLWTGYADSGYFDMPRSEYVKAEKLALKSKAIDPFLFDFTADKRIQIEHQYVTMPDLWSGVDKGDFDERVVKKLVASDYGDHTKLKEEEKVRLKRLNLNESKNEYRQEVCLSHYWGPVYQKDGRTNRIKVINEHARFIIANQKYLLTEIEDNPYPDKSTPYIVEPLIKIPFRHIGKALTEDVNSIEDAIVDFVNMQLDNLLWQLLGVTEIDQLSLTAQDKQQLKEIYPGVPIVRRPGSTELAFKRHEMGTDPTKAMPILQELKAFHDADHGVTEFLAGDPSIVDTSDPNQRQKRQDAISQFEGFATDFERGPFTKCIDKARDLICQYLAGDRNPNAETILGEQGKDLDQMSEEERKSLIVSEYNIVPRGISIFFERIRKANAYTGVYKNLNALPEEEKDWIKWQTFIPKIFESTAIDSPEDFMNTQEDVEKMRQGRQQQQQMMMQMEIQKAMAPLQTKIQMMQMGVEERTTMGRERMQAEMMKEMMKAEQKAKDTQTKAVLEAARLYLQAQMHKDKTEGESQDRQHGHLLDAANLMMDDEDMAHKRKMAEKKPMKSESANA